MPGRTLPTVLIVDDDPHALEAMRLALADDFQVLEAVNAIEARAHMEEHWVQVVLSDQRMPETTGIELLTEVRDRWPETVRILVTAYGESEAMIDAVKDAGIYQLITKPWHADQLLMAVRNAVRLFELARDHERMTLEMRYLGSTNTAKLEDRRRLLQEGLGFDNIHRGPNSPLNALVVLARQYASFDVPVLISGEPGTGKSELARAIHYGSLRSDRPYHELNCAGLDDATVRAELFGSRNGGARVGLLQKCDRGTLFLNGIDALSSELQLALSRVLRERSFQPVGAQETLTSGARVLGGAHNDLRSRVASGEFLGDLYFALAATEIQVPPLRARRGDIPLLAERLLHDAAEQHAKPVRGFAPAALEFLQRYDWPGNLNELRNEVLRMLIVSQEVTLGPELISRHILQSEPVDVDDRIASVDLDSMDGTLKDRVERMETRILRETMTRMRWNKSRAANELGLSRVGLRAKLDRYGIEPRAAIVEEE